MTADVFLAHLIPFLLSNFHFFEKERNQILMTLGDRARLQASKALQLR